jgi:hypothetical protein
VSSSQRNNNTEVTSPHPQYTRTPDQPYHEKGSTNDSKTAGKGNVVSSPMQPDHNVGETEGDKDAADVAMQRAGAFHTLAARVASMVPESER